VFFGDLYMGDHPCAAGLAFAFGGNSHAYLKTIMPERCTHLGLLDELLGQSGDILFNGYTYGKLRRRCC